MGDRRSQRREDLRRRLADAPEGTLALMYELMDAAHSDFGMTTRNLFRQLCDEEDIHFEQSDGGTASEAPSIVPRSPPISDDSTVPLPAGQKRMMDTAADNHYNLNLKRDAFNMWRDKTHEVRQNNWRADNHYQRHTARRCLYKMQNKLYYQLDLNDELEHRLKLFQTWRQRRVVERCLRSWILLHRENSLRKFQKRLAASSAIHTWSQKTANVKDQEMRAEDARDYMAASSALGVWRDKARELRGIRMFKELYLRLKWFTIWRARARKIARARYDELLKAKYQEAKRRLGMRSARRVINVWREKTAHMKENDRQADDHYNRVQEERIRKIAHDALTGMYEQTAENVENERLADSYYESNLIGRFGVLNTAGPWRTKVREVQDMEAKAEEYREIKTQEVARDALRTLRNQSARNRVMENQADDFYDRHSKRLARGHLQSWREQTAAKQGLEDMSAIAPVMPVTPAARRTALFRSVQQ